MTATSSFNRRRRGLVVSVVVVLVLAFGALGATLAAGWSPKLGLDLAGGTEVVLEAAPGHHASSSQLDTAVQIIRNRVKGVGVSGATVNVQGNQIVVQIPGVNNGRLIDKQIAETAQVYFRPVLCAAPAYVKPTGKHPKVGNPLRIPPCDTSSLFTSTNLHVSPDPNIAAGFTWFPPGPDGKFATVPSVSPLNDDPKVAVVEPAPGSGWARLVLGPSVMAGTGIASAQATTDQLGAWIVSCTLTPAASAKWDSISNTYFHEIVAFELDGQVVSAPVILPAQQAWSSFGGTIQISGNFTQASANQLAIVLQYGSLPVPLKILTTETVSPTLGHADLIAGLGAGLAGLLLVLLYVVGYYRLLGGVVLAGLAVTAAILWALISALGRTSVAPSFDLAGVTGIIVSIGITVDSYIVYFERLKDETRSGRSVRTSLERGFASAWRTVLAADTVSFLAAVLLFFLAAGSVQGFAFFLGLSTLLDVFVTWFFTRPAVALLGRNEALTSMRGMGIARGLAVSGTPS